MGGPTRETDAGSDISVTPPLNWALCVATLNRPESLETCVSCAVTQTRPPAEIVIVDASESWEAHREWITAVTESARIPCVYLQAVKRSSAVQRNQAIDAATADILFMIDDDAFMHPDCAASIMEIYETDRLAKISAVAAACAEVPPGQSTAGGLRRRDRTDFGLLSRLAGAFPRGLKSFVYKELLLLDVERRFVPYDRIGYGALAPLPDALRASGAVPIRLMSGFRMTVRRSVAERERFDDGLLAYCPTEDLDASYRFLRHGANVLASRALLYHHEAASSRLKRRKVAELSVLNTAYFIRAKSKLPYVHAAAFYVWVVRLFASSMVRDMAGRRWDLPDTSGTAKAFRKSFGVFGKPRADLKHWYLGVQQQILSN